MSAVTIAIERPEGQADFVVTLTDDDGVVSAPLTVADLTAGRWTANLDVASPPRQTDIVTRVSNAPQDQRNHRDYQEIAHTLYDWLLPAGPVRARWKTLNAAPEAPRLYVRTTVESLARLPWELAARNSDRPALINGFYRLEQGETPNRPSSLWPFRILLVVGCSEDDEKALGVDKEIEKIQRQFLRLGRTVDVHTIERPDKPTLAREICMFRPHVFHFAGHSGKVGAELGLSFDVPDGGWVWSGDTIATDLAQWRWAPDFVFLNACRSAREHAETWSAQTGFLLGGAKAVLGMQADVRGDHAGGFAGTLYERCASGAVLEVAVREARTKLSERLQSLAHLDWALPQLITTGRDVQLFAVKEHVRDIAFERCREFEEARYFADCRVQRRALTQWMYPVSRTPEAASSVLLLTGSRRSGKSHLIKWCMETWAIGGARVRYVELHTGQSRDFLSVVRQIQAGEAERKVELQYLHDELPRTAFNRFYWELNNLTSSGQARPEAYPGDNAASATHDNGAPLPAMGEKRLESTVGAGFIAALNAVAEHQPLIIVFDKLRGPNEERLLPDDEFERLWSYVFKPIADTVDSQVRLVFSAADA